MFQHQTVSVPLVMAPALLSRATGGTSLPSLCHGVRICFPLSSLSFLAKWSFSSWVMFSVVHSSCYSRRALDPLAIDARLSQSSAAAAIVQSQHCVVRTGVTSARDWLCRAMVGRPRRVIGTLDQRCGASYRCPSTTSLVRFPWSRLSRIVQSMPERETTPEPRKLECGGKLHATAGLLSSTTSS
jgi:hypothetical protein